MKNLQKGFAPIALIIIAVVVIAGIGGYFVFSKKSEPVAQQPTPPVTTQTPTPINETTSWKTYKNDTYSFEVKYPSDWTSNGSWSENGGFFYVAFGTTNSIDSKPLATLRVYPNQTTLDKFVKYFDYISGTWKDTTLNGVSAKEVVSTGQNSQQFILTASVKNSYGYELASTVFGNNVDTVRKMNSTFKFTKPVAQVTIAGHIGVFEQAVNNSDFSTASKYLADKVYVVLEGSSCCGEISASQAKMYLENETKGLVFTFNPNDAVVKEYIASQYVDYPNRRLIKDSPKLYFDELSIGVEFDVSQQNKASIGYKVSNDKITVLFINKGRDR